MECFRRNTRPHRPAWWPVRAELRRDRARVKKEKAIRQREQAPRLDPRPGSSQLPHVTVLDLRAIRDQSRRALPGWEYLLEPSPARYQESCPFLYSAAKLGK